MSHGRDDNPRPDANVVIGVMMGAASREREVSLASGRAVAAALATLGYDARAMDVRPGEIDADMVAPLDVAFLALHGAWGEDGEAQAELDRLGLPYTGSGPEASRLAMDKLAAKERFEVAGLATPPYRVVPRLDDAALMDAFESLGPKTVAKPVAEGSSFGVHMCDGPAALAEAAEELWGPHPVVLVERQIEGRELTVGILGGEPLPVIEIRTPGGWYDYHMKYESDRTEYVFDHGLPEAEEAEVVGAALAAHEALGCRDLSRVDLILPPGGEPHVLEVNTIPGFTDHSLVPKAAAKAGLTFPRLCERIVELALARQPSRT